MVKLCFVISNIQLIDIHCKFVLMLQKRLLNTWLMCLKHIYITNLKSDVSCVSENIHVQMQTATTRNPEYQNISERNTRRFYSSMYNIHPSWEIVVIGQLLTRYQSSSWKWHQTKTTCTMSQSGDQLHPVQDMSLILDTARGTRNFSLNHPQHHLANCQ